MIKRPHRIGRKLVRMTRERDAALLEVKRLRAQVDDLVTTLQRRRDLIPVPSAGYTETTGIIIQLVRQLGGRAFIPDDEQLLSEAQILIRRDEDLCGTELLVRSRPDLAMGAGPSPDLTPRPPRR